MCKTKWYHIMVGMHVRGKSIKKFRGMINIPFGKEFLGGGGNTMDGGRVFSHIGKVLFLDLSCR